MCERETEREREKGNKETREAAAHIISNNQYFVTMLAFLFQS
jgi:hypothetical protein